MHAEWEAQRRQLLSNENEKDVFQHFWGKHGVTDQYILNKFPSVVSGSFQKNHEN